MTVDEKIGQLFMVQMQSVWPEKDLDSLESLIRNYHLGGLIVFKKEAATVRHFVLTECSRQLKFLCW